MSSTVPVAPPAVAARLAHAGLIPSALGALLVCCLVDRKLCPRHGRASWLTLRFHLGAVAALCCFIGAAGA